MANKSAVQYHFGSKEGLVEAILVNRLDDLDRRRALLQARTSADDLRGVVEAHHLPLIELAEEPQLRRPKGMATRCRKLAPRAIYTGP